MDGRGQAPQLEVRALLSASGALAGRMQGIDGGRNVRATIREPPT